MALECGIRDKSVVPDEWSLNTHSQRSRSENLEEHRYSSPRQWGVERTRRVRAGFPRRQTTRRSPLGLYLETAHMHLRSDESRPDMRASSIDPPASERRRHATRPSQFVSP